MKNIICFRHIIQAFGIHDKNKKWKCSGYAVDEVIKYSVLCPE